MTTNLEHFKQIQEQDSDVMCCYCGLPIPNREAKMKVDNHLACWKSAMYEARVNKGVE